MQRLTCISRRQLTTTTDMEEEKGVVVDTFERQVHTEDAVLRVEAGTTGPTGGDRSSDSRTFLDLTVLYGDFLIEPEREEDLFQVHSSEMTGS